MARKNKKLFYDFESLHKNGAFTKISNDMIKSKAWKQLSLRQHGLYLHLKSKFTKYKNQDTNVNDITIPKKEALTLYGDLKTLRKDIDILIAFGFIRQIKSGWNTWTSNIYGFSDKWRLFGTDKFSIPETDKRYQPKKIIK